jgi:hypothetical protein
MSHLFTLSYIFILGGVLVESLLLRAVLHKTMWFDRFYGESRRSSVSSDPPALQDPVPEFSLFSLQTDTVVTTADLKGHASILCFISPQLRASRHNLIPALHAWWHKMERHVYLVCAGPAEVCRDVVRENAGEFPLDKVICDEDGVLSQAFHISSTPQAVELDEDGIVKRLGRPESLELGIDESGDSQDRPSGQAAWPDDRAISGAGFARVDTTISCVLSRFRLNSPLSLIPFYFAFRRVRREARSVGGLLEAVFLVEGARTCYTLSLWRDDWSIVEFGGIRSHIDAANSVFGATYHKDAKRAEIWSAQFRLWALSCHNLNWDGLDVEDVLGEEQWRRRAEVARMTRHGEEQRIA